MEDDKLLVTVQFMKERLRLSRANFLDEVEVANLKTLQSFQKSQAKPWHTDKLDQFLKQVDFVKDRFVDFTKGLFGYQSWLFFKSATAYGIGYLKVTSGHFAQVSIICMRYFSSIAIFDTRQNVILVETQSTVDIH